MKPVSIWAGGLCLAVSVALAACGGEDGAPGPPVSVPSPSPSPSPTPTPTPTPTPSPGATLAYQSAADYALSSGARAVVIIHDGRMVLEQYANGGRADRGEALASGTKSFTCVLMAAAEDDGFLSVDDLASTLVPQWRVGGLAPQTDLKAQIRTRDLLSVSSGLLNSGVFGAALNTVDSYAQAFNAPSQFAPGTHAIYTPNSAQAVSAIFELATGGAFDSAGVIRGGRDGITYLQQRVFDPIGVAPTEWSRDVNAKPNFGGGASFTAKDWAVFGQFSAQLGEWQGRQIVSRARMSRCFTYATNAFLGYGFGWWLNRSVGTTFSSEDSIPWPGDVTARWASGGQIAPSAPSDMAIAFGAGNRKLYVSPGTRLSLVVIGGTANDEDLMRRLFAGS